jgi:pilus assembly protein CpaC
LLGGLIQNTQSRAIRKIPVLGDLPILGQLFRSENFQTNKTDLIIMVTPEVAK